MNRKDRGACAFYDEAAQGLIDKFGYSHDGKVYVEAETLTSEQKSKYYQALRSVSRHFLSYAIGVLTRCCLENGAMVPPPQPGEVL